MLRWLCLIVTVLSVMSTAEDENIILASLSSASFSQELDCFGGFDPDSKFPTSCIPSSCSRKVIDGIFSDEDVDKLHEIAQKGMDTRAAVGGPTILDINTGYIRDSVSLDNLFVKSTDTFTADDFAHYGRIIHQLRDEIRTAFGIETVYFTAPTFITRIDATGDWQPKEIHDEYWHPHVDRNNTPHYHYSGLLYMSTYGEDFTGGRLLFLDPNDYSAYENGLSTFDSQPAPQLIVEPKRGRVAIFSSGMENTHQVERVLSGSRFVLSFWFTCDPVRQFEIFLDGQAHVQFSRKFKDRLLEQSKQRQQQQQQQQQSKQKQPRTKQKGDKQQKAPEL